jgi:molybdate transport system substrate-binding protein
VHRNVVSREANVRALLVRVELGEADGGIMYETDARSSRKVRSIPILAAANVTAEYPIAAVTASRQRAGADLFVKFVLGSRGRAVLKRHGFR